MKKYSGIKQTLLLLSIIFICASFSKNHNVEPTHIKLIDNWRGPNVISWNDIFRNKTQTKTSTTSASKKSTGGLLVAKQEFLELTPGVPVSGSGDNFYFITVQPNTYAIFDLTVEEGGFNIVQIGTTPSPYQATYFLDGTTTNVQFKAQFGCDPQAYYFYISASGGFTLTASLVSDVIVVDSPTVQAYAGVSEADFYTIQVTEECTDVNIFLAAEESFNGLILSQNCATNTENAPFDFCAGNVGVYETDLGTDRQYYSVSASCLAAGNYKLRVRFPQESTPRIRPYTLNVTSTNAPCSTPDCSGNGVCFNGQCFCEGPFTGASCESIDTTEASTLPYSGTIPAGVSYYYVQLDRTEVLTNNVAFQIVNGPFLSIVGSKGGFANEDNTFVNQVAFVENVNFYREVCSSQATGLFVFRVNNLAGVEAPFTFDYSLVDRTTLTPSTTVENSFANDNTGRFYAQYYRLQTPTSPELSAVATGNEFLFGLALVDDSECLFLEQRPVRGVSDLSAPGRGVYQVGFEDCYPYDPTREYYVAVAGRSPSTAFTLDIEAVQVPCSNECVNGICGNGECVCYQGFSGATCEEVLFTEIQTNQQVTGVSPADTTITYFFTVEDPNAVLELNYVSDFGNSIAFITRNPSDSVALFDSSDNIYCSNQPTNGTYYVNVKNLGGFDDSFSFIVTEANTNIETNQPVSGSITDQDLQNVYSFELTQSQSAHITISFAQFAASENQIVVETTYSSCKRGNTDYNSYNGENFDTIEVDIPQSCIGRTYFVRIYSNGLIYNFDYTIEVTTTETQTCPNCCSNVGTCNGDLTCSCPPGYSGADCSVPICILYDNPFCGVDVPFTFHPILAQTFQQIQNDQGCDLQTIVSRYDEYIRVVLTGNRDGDNDTCPAAIGQGYCNQLFLPCNPDRSAVRVPCRSECISDVQECFCGDESGAEAACDAIEIQYPTSALDLVSNYNDCPVPQSTTGDILPITSEALTTLFFTTEFLTTQEATTSPITSASVTSAGLTTSPLTTAPVTSSPLTTSPVTTSPVTTSALTSAGLTTNAQPLTTRSFISFTTGRATPLTTRAITSSALTTRGVTSSPLTTRPATTAALTSSPLTTQSLTTRPVSTQALTTRALTTSPLTTRPATTAALTTRAITSSALTTRALTTKSLTTKAMTTKPLSTGKPPITTKKVVTTGGRVTTKALTTAKFATTGKTKVTTGRVTTGQLSPQAVCSQYSFTGIQGYFCSGNQQGFYQCLKGPFAPQSAYFNCPAGTLCQCPQGVECSTFGSPCTFPNSNNSGGNNHDDDDDHNDDDDDDGNGGWW